MTCLVYAARGVMLKRSKHVRKGLCPHSLRVLQTDNALYIISKYRIS